MLKGDRILVIKATNNITSGLREDEEKIMVAMLVGVSTGWKPSTLGKARPGPTPVPLPLIAAVVSAGRPVPAVGPTAPPAARQGKEHR